ncbi:MAG: cell surface protein SprA [Gemmatimonadaceae bacterium]
MSVFPGRCGLRLLPAAACAALLWLTLLTPRQAAAQGSTPPAGPVLTPKRVPPADSARLLGTGTPTDNPLAGLGMALNARLESKLARTRNLRCTAAQLTLLSNSCAGAFQPAFDFQFSLRTAGVVAERLHLNVDYDSQREFDASNAISVFYQGKAGEVLQKLEVGNVNFPAPVSRFLTAGIPAGNYGIQATGQFGALRVTSMLAQQKGNVSRDNVFVVGDRTQQATERAIEDIQIETRRFFFTIDPRLLPGFPNIDLLNRSQLLQAAAALPDTIRPTRIVLYRQLVGAANPNPRGPRLAVRGARNPAPQVYEVLRENIDYVLDPSGLWLALVRPLQANGERLAIAYEVTVNGTPQRYLATGGTPDIEATDAPQVANLLWEPELQPSSPAYFLREIKSVYRLGGDDLQRESLALRVVTGLGGDQEKPVDPSRGGTYLQLFGLAQATNPSALDIENRVWPRRSDANVSALSGGRDPLLRDAFLFFPSVQPFARAGLAQPAGNPANDTLYRFPNEYLYSTQRPQAVFRLMLQYQSSGGDAPYTIQLMSQQIRPNSERLTLEGQPLLRDRDYRIEYELGTITFVRGDTLFPRPRPVTVRYEENPLFATIPTTMLGITSALPIPHGELTFTAISQTQRSGYNRPMLGFESAGSIVAGMTGALAWDAPLLNRLTSQLTVTPSARPSRLSLQGEFAVSRPQPNAAGQAYLESFEGNAGLGVALGDAAWYVSSRPAIGGALTGLVGSGTFALNRATALAYQNYGLDANGAFVQYRIDQIDPAVRTAGSGLQGAEPLLWLSLYPLRAGGLMGRDPATGTRRAAWTVGGTSAMGATPTGRRWRSLRTVLNPTGADLSRIETLEFFALVQVEPAKLRRNPTLVFDVGEISENSVAFAPETLTVAPPLRAGLAPDSTWRGKRLVGYDRLDSERDPFSRAFNAAINDTGLPGDLLDSLTVVDRTGGAPVTRTATGVPLCSQAIGTVQSLGDTRANCTVRNSRLDEEDLDQDGQLNVPSALAESEQIRRYAVDLSDRRSWTRVGGCFRQADSSGTTVVSDSVCWVQVRLNWRTPLEQLNAPNERRMRTLRLTMVSNGQAADEDLVQTAIARLNLVGAPWVKRSEMPLSGAAGDSAAVTGGYVVASLIGTMDSTAALPYTPPPGVVESPENKQTGYENVRVQVNERALRLQTGIPGRVFRPFDRAEAYFRFPEGTKSFMGYRTLRMWMRGRGNGWGPSGELNGFIKIGRDEHNFYMYRTPVNAGPTQSAWDPEVRVDLTRFQALRAQLETNVLTASPDSLACTGVDLELLRRSGLPRQQLGRRYAVCRDGYIVYSADPLVTPPNLAGVQELAVGLVRVDSVARGGTAIMANDTLELWVNDIRLSDVVADMGMAGELGLSVNAGDLADLRMAVSRRDPNFRQLGETPGFLTTSGVTVGTTVHLERLLPERLGVVMPLTVDYTGQAVDPFFVARTDIRASGVPGVRTPHDRRLSYALAMRRATPLTSGWYAPVVNGLSLTGAWSSGQSQSAFQRGTATNYLLGSSLDLRTEAAGTMPWALRALLDRLPTWMRESEMARAIVAEGVRARPTAFRLSSTVSRSAIDNTSYGTLVASLRDSGQTVRGLTHAWVNAARLEFRPLAGLTGTIDARQVLDLRDVAAVTHGVDSTARRAAAALDRLQLLGTSLGLEQDRLLSSGLRFQPVTTAWLQPRFDWRSTFRLGKDLNARTLLRDADSLGAFRLPQRAGATNSLATGAQLQLGRVLTALASDHAWVRTLAGMLAPADVNWQQDLTSGYDNAVLDPGIGYQFGLGGVEAFRGTRSGRWATAAGRVQTVTTSGALALPLSLTLQTRFERGTTETWTRRFGSDAQTLISGDRRTYPDLSLRWGWRPTGRAQSLISLISINGRYALTEQHTIMPSGLEGIADRSAQRARSQPLSGAITWAGFGNLVTGGSIDHIHREDVRPGSLTAGDTRRFSVDVVRSLPLPAQWKTRTGLLRTRLSYQSEATLATVTAARDGVPVPAAVGMPSVSVLTDNGRQAFNVNADTDVSETLTFSLTGSHILNFDRNLNRRLATTVFSVIFQMRFFAGELP